MRQIPTFLEVQERARSHHYAKFGRGPDFTRRRGCQKRSIFCLSVCCLSVYLSVTLLKNVKVCAPDFALNALEYRNDFDAVG